MSVKLFNFNLLNENLTTITIFKNREKEIYFKAKDAAKMLGYQNTKDAIIKHVSDKYKLKYKFFQGVTIHDPLNSIQPETVFIKESGMYELIFSSELPQAILFREFVLEEVLPTLRKTGKYQMNNALAKIKNINLLDIENLTPEQFLEYKKELKEKTEEVKIEYHVRRGQRGGSKTQENIRKTKKEIIELKEELEQQKIVIEKLKEEKLYFQDECNKLNEELFMIEKELYSDLESE